MGDVGVICHTIYVSNLNEKIKKPLLKKSLHRCVHELIAITLVPGGTAVVGGGRLDQYDHLGSAAR